MLLDLYKKFIVRKIEVSQIGLTVFYDLCLLTQNGTYPKYNESGLYK